MTNPTPPRVDQLSTFYHDDLLDVSSPNLKTAGTYHYHIITN